MTRMPRDRAALSRFLSRTPFFGGLDDIATNGMELVREIVEIYDNYEFATEVLVASCRHPIHIVEAARMGADIATCPPAIRWSRATASERRSICRVRGDQARAATQGIRTGRRQGGNAGRRRRLRLGAGARRRGGDLAALQVRPTVDRRGLDRVDLRLIGDPIRPVPAP